MSGKTVWVRGRPARGVVMGLLMGAGIFLLLTRFELIPIDTAPLLGCIVGGIVVGIARALIGRPYRVILDSREDATEA